jgi:D-alanyl-D-alanine carboxypeptidase
VIALAGASLQTGCGDSPRADEGDGPGTGGVDDDEGDGATEADVSEDGADDGLDDDGAGDEGGSDDGGPVDDPGDPYEPAPALPTLPDDVVQSIAADIDAALASSVVSGTSKSVLVVDAETGQEIYARDPELFLKPASNTKLFTTAAAMETLGEDHRALTEVRADAAPDAAGHVAGDLHLVVHHDFTLSPLFGMSADATLDRVAEDLWDAGVRSVGGALVVHGEAVYDGYQFAYYDAAAHRGAVASAFASSLSGAGISLAGGASTAADFAEAPTVLTTWSSAPLSVGCAPINVISHNEFADVLVRHVGHELSGDSSYAGGTQQVIEWLASLPTDTSQVALHDGSGLSHDNRVAARTIVDLVRFMLDAREGQAWVRTFSVGGVRGTLGSRLTGPDTWGRVWGKTGSLTGVITTSGLVFNRHDGRRYVFSILMNDVGSTDGVRGVHDEVIAVAARDHFADGPRPDAPVLTAVRAAESDVLEIEWSAVEGATGYLVWLSADGRTWNRADARMVQGPQHRAGDLAPHLVTEGGLDVFVRVTAIGPGGESEPSDVYGSRAEAGFGRVLVVDGFDRWQAEPMIDNPLGGGHDFVVPLATSMGGAVVWDTAANEAVIDGTVDLGEYDAVLWLLGEESVDHETFDTTEQGLVAEYLEGGGNLFVSGSEIGWDLVELGDPADTAFFADVLHASYLGDDAESWIVDGSAGTFAGVGPAGFFAPATLEAHFPDQLAPGPGAEAIASYWGGSGGTAGVAWSSDHRVVLLGFPFETITHPDDRAAWMSAVLELFGI